MKNLKHTLFTFIALLCATFSTAQNNNDNTLLYKIEGNGIKPSYVFGTIHMMPKEDFKLTDLVKNAAISSEQIALELDMDDPNFQAEALKASYGKEGMKLSEHVDADELKIINSFLTKTMGVQLTAFDAFKPITLSSLVMISAVGKDFASYEGEFIKIAEAEKKEIIGLETIEVQMSIFDTMSYEKQLDDVVEMISGDGGTEEYFKKIIKAYNQADADAIVDSMATEYEYSDETMAAMLENRNRDWVTKIPTISKEKSTFYAVGAAHLGGDTGVLDLLKKEGFTVTPVK